MIRVQNSEERTAVTILSLTISSRKFGILCIKYGPVSCAHTPLGVWCVWGVTWGKNSTANCSIEGYHKPIFKVRKSEGMNKGGGVACWIKDSIAYEEIISPFKEKIIETVAISLPTLKLTVLNVYRGFGSVDTVSEILAKNPRCQYTKEGHHHTGGL